ncbi:facilitated trehalose transporter Tret1-like [Macrobrachium nipponense]|uniref:facilitated trehalose transporter Tret1-like n=1 Tax=Macrobrachium nipponense TaxID=159736 RepID=UPI0030C8AEDC
MSVTYQNDAFEPWPETLKKESPSVSSDKQEDQKHSEAETSQEEPRKRRWRLFKQTLLVLNMSMAMWGIGSINIFSSVIAHDQETHNTTIYGNLITFSDYEFDELNSLKTLATLASSCLTGVMMNHFGRRSCMAISGMLAIAGWIGIAFVSNVNGMLGFRIISGLAVSGLRMSTAAYVVEIVDREIRGTMASIVGSGVFAGHVVTLGLSFAFRYYTVCLLLTIFQAISLVSIFWFPTSPSVLVLQGREEQAREALVRLRGTHADIDAEIQVYKDANQVTKGNRSAWKSLFAREVIADLARVCTLCIFTHFTGFYLILSNVLRVFKESRSSLDNHIASNIVAFIQFVSVLFASMLVDKLGRRNSLMMSFGITSVPLAVMAAYSASLSDSTQETNYAWIPVVCMVIAEATVVLGAVPVTHILCSEYFPTFLRPQALSICGLTFNLAGFLLLQFYTQMIEGMTATGVFAMYSCSCVVAVIFTFFAIKETRGEYIG